MSDISCAVYSVRTALGGKATAAYVNALLNYSCRNFVRMDERKRLASPPQVPRGPPERAAFYHASACISSNRRLVYHPTAGGYIIPPWAGMLSYTYPRASGERAHYPRRERRREPPKLGKLASGNPGRPRRSEFREQNGFIFISSTARRSPFPSIREG